MWDTARLDHIFHRRFFAKTTLDDFDARFAAQEKSKITMEIEPNRERLHVTS